METVVGQNDMRLTCALSLEGAVILRAETADERVTLPDTVFGRPVVALGEKAFAAGHYACEGEVLQMVCKADADDAAGDNSRIAAVALPQTLRSVGDYAFYNCDKLKSISLYSAAVQWGSCALMNCRALSMIDLHILDTASVLLRRLVGELPQELDVTLHYPDGATARLLFPEYYEYIDENVPARIFDYHIMGAGYPYRYCFRDAALDLRSYDELWAKYLNMDYDARCADKLAFFRLRYPYMLTPKARADYLSYVQGRVVSILEWLLEIRDMRAVDFLLRMTNPDTQALAAGAEQARRHGCAEALAMLLAAQHKSAPAGAKKSFDL